MDQFGGSWNPKFQATQEPGADDKENDALDQHALVSPPADPSASEHQWAIASAGWMNAPAPPPSVGYRPDPSYPAAFGSYLDASAHPNFQHLPGLSLESSFEERDRTETYGVGPVREPWPMSGPSYGAGAGPSACTAARRKEVPILPANKRPADAPDDAARAKGILSPPEVPKKKRGRPRLDPSDEISSSKRGSISGPSGDGTPGDTVGVPDDPDSLEAKRSELRARNRAAATRYRNKIQALGSKLEAEGRQRETERESLLACADQLRDEILRLKCEVLQHSGCDCPVIQGYLSGAAPESYATMTAPQSNWMRDSTVADEGSGAVPEEQKRFDEHHKDSWGDTKM